MKERRSIKKLLAAALFAVMVLAMSMGVLAAGHSVSVSGVPFDAKCVPTAAPNYNVAGGVPVTLTAPEKSGLRFDKWEVVKGPGVTIVDNRFNMPHDSDVEIKAIYKKTVEGLTVTNIVEPASGLHPVTTGMVTSFDGSRATVAKATWRRVDGKYEVFMSESDTFVEGYQYTLYIEFNMVGSFAEMDKDASIYFNMPNKAERVGPKEYKFTFTAKHAHKGAMVPAVPATTQANGVKAYYECACGDVFSDAACEHRINGLDIWKKGEGKIPMLANPAVGTIIVDPVSKATYRILTDDPAKLEAAFVKCAESPASAVKVPRTIELQGFTYTVTEIDNRAFYENTSMTKLTIGMYVRTVGMKAFYGCSNLQTVIGGQGIEHLGSYAFKGCKSLKSITLQSKLSWVGTQVLSGTKSLKTLKITSTLLTKQNTKKGAFKGLGKKAKVKFPSKKKKAYKSLKKYWGIK